jgi:hypothetical protein
MPLLTGHGNFVASQPTAEAVGYFQARINADKDSNEIPIGIGNQGMRTLGPDFL